MPKYSAEDLEHFVMQNRRDILDIRNAIKILLKEIQDQNDKMLKLSKLSKGQLEIITSLSHTVNLITDKLADISKALEEEE